MSLDLTEAMRKMAQKGRPTKRSIRQKAFTAIAKKERSRWPTTDVYKPFVSLAKEELYDNLIDYRLSLDPHTKKDEIAALSIITNRLPWPLVPILINYMQKTNSQSFKVALSRFVDSSKSDKVIKSIQQSRAYLAKRKAIPAAPQRTRYDRDPVLACFAEYKKALWVPVVLGKDVEVIEMVSRHPFGEMIKSGWYRLPEKWYENVCRFGRSYREDYVGYLMSDGRILAENRELFNASMKHSRYSSKSTNCQLEYLNAPWLDFSVKGGVFMMVARKTRSTQDWIRDEVRGTSGWYRLGQEWVKQVCEKGRPFVKGDIGYYLNNGVVIEETHATYLLANAYVRNMKGQKKAVHVAECDVSRPVLPWVKRGNRSAIGMVAVKSPKTVLWIVPSPIPGTKWYPMNKNWYSHVCASGRKWQPGLFGYLFANGEIVPETEQMFNDYLTRPDDSVVSPQYLENARRQLLGILSENEVDLLMEYIDKDNLTDFLDTVARIVVFGSKILNIPQVHVDRLRRGQYEMRVLPLLRPAMMLPEIYADPMRNPETARNDVLTWKNFDEMIERRMERVKSSIISSKSDFARRYREVIDEPIAVRRVPRAGIDTVYYQEDGVMYAFDRSQVIDADVNPTTGKPFTQEFMQEIRLVRDPLYDVDVEMVEEPSRLVPIPPPSGTLTDPLAPRKRKADDESRVVAKIRKLIFSFGGSECPDCSGSGYAYGSKCVRCGRVCAQCGESVSDPEYSSVYGGETVVFCSSGCFDDFRFRK